MLVGIDVGGYDEELTTISGFGTIILSRPSATNVKKRPLEKDPMWIFKISAYKKAD